MQNSYTHIRIKQPVKFFVGKINTFYAALVLLLLGIRDLQWVKNTLRGISMRLTENCKFGKTHFSLESVKFWKYKNILVLMILKVQKDWCSLNSVIYCETFLHRFNFPTLMRCKKKKLRFYLGLRTRIFG